MAKQQWFQKASVQTALVTGAVLIILTLIQAYSGNSKLKGRIVGLEDRLAIKDSEVRHLETMLVPFQTVALDRYPGDMTSALSKLADDLQSIQSKLDQSLGTVSSFEAEISMRVTADWISGTAPEISGFLQMGGHSDTKLAFRNSYGEIVNVDLYAAGGPTVESISENSSLVTYRSAARAGEWPIGSDIRDILSCEGGTTVLYGIDSTFPKDGILDQLALKITIFINGAKKWVVTPKTAGPLDISKSVNGSTEIIFKGSHVLNYRKGDST